MWVFPNSIRIAPTLLDPLKPQRHTPECLTPKPISLESEVERFGMINLLLVEDNEKLRPAMNLIDQQARQRHAILDSRESYARTAKRCSKW